MEIQMAFTNCPQCGKPKDPKYRLCFLCNRKSIKPTTERAAYQPRQAVAKVNAQTVAVLRKAFAPSVFQQAIFDFIVNGKGNAVVEAVAGSGKTTTLVEALNLVDSKLNVAFLAFNKSIAEELKSRAPANVHASTLHSLGLQNCMKFFIGSKVDVKKLIGMIFDYRDDVWAGAGDNIKAISQLVNLLKGALLEPTVENMDFLSDRHNVVLNSSRGDIFKAVQVLYAQSIQDISRLDFEDMIYFCAIGRVPCQQFDFLFVDEAQDMNKAQREMIRRSLSGRLIAVGDRNQSIYGFRGADAESIPNFITEFNATVLPLSISYRCAQKIIDLAQSFVPEIMARDGAPLGAIDTITNIEFFDKVAAGDMVLCRTNAPLVRPCFDLLAQGTKAIIRGRDIGENLIKLIKKFEKPGMALSELMEIIGSETRKQMAEAERKDKKYTVQYLEDTLFVLEAFAERVNTISDMKLRIEQIFSDDTAAVVFSSVHRAKGLESERVFILKPELMPFPKATQPWELIQEHNIQYIAVTRAKSELFWVIEA